MAIVYGVHPVEELLDRRWRQVKGLLITRKHQAAALVQLARSRRIPIQDSSPRELDALCGGGSHQGIVAVVGEYDYVDLEDLLEQEVGPPLLLVLDSIQDPQNLGAIFRSGLVLGATGVVIPQNRAASITPTVVRVSAGATEHLPCAMVTNIARCLTQLKEAGLWVVGTVESGGSHPADLPLAEPAAVVLGNEQKGIRPLVRKQCDVLATIPGPSAIASLNVGAAAVAFCYEAARQRRGTNKEQGTRNKD